MEGETESQKRIYLFTDDMTFSVQVADRPPYGVFNERDEVSVSNGATIIRDRGVDGKFSRAGDSVTYARHRHYTDPEIAELKVEGLYEGETDTFDVRKIECPTRNDDERLEGQKVFTEGLKEATRIVKGD